VPPITSRQNPIVTRFREAARREADGVVLLDGPHLVTDALDAGTPLREAAVGTDASDHPEVAHLVERMQQLGIPVAEVTSLVMSALSPVRSASPIVAVAEEPSTDLERVFNALSFAVIAIDVQDPGNLGAIVRVAEAGGAGGVICAGACADPFGWKALRGSMGSALRLPIAVTASGDDAMEAARRRGYQLIASVPRDGQSLFAIDLTKPLALLIGSEGPGLSAAHAEAADQRIMIPMHAPVESLNAAVTAALIVYEAHRQRHISQDTR